ncbi:uncharacterized protein [Malus domestica]|uniref:uncharacterized protein n=1 Tax=Malus domestica TaxID=3750 RepID=UPI003974CFED
MALCQNTMKSLKTEKFKGLDFKRWQHKMLFFLTTMNLAHVVKEEALKSNENPKTKEIVMAIKAWNHYEFCYRNYILNSLDDNLYDIYSLCKTTKELWESLEKKYKIDDTGSKKFVIGKFLKYTMVDSKSVVSQVKEIHKLIYELHFERCEINEHFQVGAIIEKLPTSWNYYQIYLKHKRREMNMEDLIQRLRVEEDHKKADRSGGFAAILRPSRRRIRL